MKENTFWCDIPIREVLTVRGWLRPFASALDAIALYQGGP